MQYCKGHNVLHTVTVSLLTLPSCISSHHFRAAQGQHRNTQASLFQPRYGTPRGTNRATSVPCARHLTVSGDMPCPASPMQSCAGRCLAPAGGYRPIRHSLLYAVTSVFPFSHRVTPTKDLCVSFLLAVSNHSPAVWFIQSASVIPVKCSA